MKFILHIIFGLFSTTLMAASCGYAGLVQTGEHLDGFHVNGKRLSGVYDLTFKNNTSASKRQKNTKKGNLAQKHIPFDTTPLSLGDLQHRLKEREIKARVGNSNIVVGGMIYTFDVDVESCIGLFVPFNRGDMFTGAFYSGTTLRQGNPGVGNYCATWEKNPKSLHNCGPIGMTSIVEGFKDRLEGLSELEDGGQSLGMTAKILDYTHKWLYEWPSTITQQLVGGVGALSSPADSPSDILSLNEGLSDFRDCIAKHSQERDKHCGAIVDSEQLWLDYIRGHPGTILPDMAKLRAMMEEVAPEYAEFIREDNARTAFVNLYSTNEVCGSCAPHICYELQSGRGFEIVRNFLGVPRVEGMSDSFIAPYEKDFTIVHPMSYGELVEFGSTVSFNPLYNHPNTLGLLVSFTEKLGEDCYYRPGRGAYDAEVLPSHDLGELSSKGIYLQTRLTDLPPVCQAPSRKSESPSTPYSRVDTPLDRCSSCITHTPSFSSSPQTPGEELEVQPKRLNFSVASSSGSPSASSSEYYKGDVQAEVSAQKGDLDFVPIVTSVS